MTPTELRRAATLMEDWIPQHIPRAADLARKLRAEADATEPTKPRRPVETRPACGGTGWQD